MTIHEPKPKKIPNQQLRSHSAQSIANAFIGLSRSKQAPLTNLQIQNLVYFAHGWHLALTGLPLVREVVMAWNFGPVIPPLYNALKKHGNGTVDETIPGHPPPKGEEFAAKLIEKILEIHGHLSGSKLLAITHLDGSPWDITYKKEKFSIINNDLIGEYFKGLLKPDASPHRNSDVKNRAA
jgi:uncharacterized phage-associated protein